MASDRWCASTGRTISGVPVPGRIARKRQVRHRWQDGRHDSARRARQHFFPGGRDLFPPGEGQGNRRPPRHPVAGRNRQSASAISRASCRRAASASVTPPCRRQQRRRRRRRTEPTLSVAQTDQLRRGAGGHPRRRLRQAPQRGTWRSLRRERPPKSARSSYGCWSESCVKGRLPE